MESDAQALLWDARDAARRIARFTAGKAFDDYLGDELLRAGVERQFAIVGGVVQAELEPLLMQLDHLLEDEA